MNSNLPIEKPGWVEFYMGLAFHIKERSSDGQTKHGCFITTKDNFPLSIGYNSFPRKMRDNELPNTRPDKYKWILHDAENGILNCLISPRLLPTDSAIIYMTGVPCLHCCNMLWQYGITTWYVAERAGMANETDEDRENFRIFLDHTGVILNWFSKKDENGHGRLNWLSKVNNELKNIGFID